MRNPVSSAFAQSRNAGNNQNFDQSLPEFILQIERGRTQFPSRPIDSPEFLVGAAEHCQLRLGGSGMPDLHSRIVRDKNGLRIEALASTPPLTINGKVVTHGTLSDGDCLSIGSFEFQLHREAALANEAIAVEAEIQESDLDEFHAEDLRELSAAELVDLIERETTMVDEFESRQKQGAMALLDAVRARREQRTETPAAVAAYDVLLPMSAQSGTEVAEGEEELSAGLQQLLVQLTELSQALEKRSDRLTQREAGYAEAVTQLMDAQDKLAMQLEFVAGRLSKMQPEQATKPTRAIA